MKRNRTVLKKIVNHACIHST